MILTVYLALFGIAVLLLAVGVFLGENYFSFTALFFLFLLGNSLLFNGVDYRTGEIEVSEYHYFNDTSPATDNFLINSTDTLTYAYTTLNDALSRWFGFFIAIASAGGMAAILTQANRDFKAGKEYNRNFGGD